MNRIVVRQDKLRNIFEALFMVLKQEGNAPDDDNDEILALCPTKFNALKIARLLRLDAVRGAAAKEGNKS
jgi:hypothetical protein